MVTSEIINALCPISSCPQSARVNRTLTIVFTSIMIGVAAASSLSGTYTQIVLTTAVIGLGILMARRYIAWSHIFPKTMPIVLAIGAVWEVCILLLIWTELRSELIVWRIAWMAIVIVLGSTHVIRLQSFASDRHEYLVMFSLLCVSTLTLLLLYPAIRTEFPKLPSTAFFWALAFPAVATWLSTIVLSRYNVDRDRRIVGSAFPNGVRRGFVSHLALVAIGLCVGRSTAPHRELVEVSPSSLAYLTHEELSIQLEADLERLRKLDLQVTNLVSQMGSLQSEIDMKFKVEQRDYYLPHEGSEMRSLFRKYLAQRASLLHMMTIYSGLDELSDPMMRARCFTLGLTAAMRTYESSVKIILMFRDHMLVRRKLNESQQLYGVDGGMFDWVYESVTSERNIRYASRMADRFTRHRTEWQNSQVWPTTDWDWIDKRITSAMVFVNKHPIDNRLAAADLLVRRISDEAYAPIYNMQSTIAEWMGDTRIVDQPPSIQSHQVETIKSKLKPGDIFLQRREWYVGNAFLPGFWTHSAMYLGTIEDLRRLGIADHPNIQSHLAAYLAPTSDGSDRTVIEAISEGVVFNSLMESLHADHVAVLRPNLSEREIAQAIVNAFEFHGRPYDFEFDFATADKLVCTELLYRAYQDTLNFNLINIMGRNTLPAVEFARKFARERHDRNHQLEFLLFYETPQSLTVAQRGSESSFLATIIPSSLASSEKDGMDITMEFSHAESIQAN